MNRPDALRKVVALYRKAWDAAVGPDEAAACARKAAELRQAHHLSSDEIRAAFDPAAQQAGSPPPSGRGSRSKTGGGCATSHPRPRPAPADVPPPLQAWQQAQQDFLDMCLDELRRAVRRNLR